MRRSLSVGLVALLLLLIAAVPVLACGGLIGANGAVNLLRTTTFAGYHDGVEHYVTAFKFGGGKGDFGSIVPLPGVPSRVERGGAWTLQRLVNETAGGCDCGSAGGAEELFQTKIGALDVTVLRGGARDVGVWAKRHGFRLPPDAPQVLDFYARRSPIFLAARFDADRARRRGEKVGDGTPVHISIPIDNPWVPLRILALGKQDSEVVDAHVYLMTDHRPDLLPQPKNEVNGLFLGFQERASNRLLKDLKADKGMGWVPTSAWLTELFVQGTASQVTYDLAIDTTDAHSPSMVAAGLLLPETDAMPSTPPALPDWLRLLVFAGIACAAAVAGARLVPVGSGGPGGQGGDSGVTG